MCVIPQIATAYNNLILSNVPGPQTQLYFLGCQVDTMYPLGPILGGAGLNITVMSLNGELGIGIISCPDLLPDLWDIADEFSDALKELLECSDEQPEGDDPADARADIWPADLTIPRQ
jgi:diacylglycerol O-acyltransferase / wax synthase